MPKASTQNKPRTKARKATSQKAPNTSQVVEEKISEADIRKAMSVVTKAQKLLSEDQMIDFIETLTPSLTTAFFAYVRDGKFHLPEKQTLFSGHLVDLEQSGCKVSGRFLDGQMGSSQVKADGTVKITGFGGFMPNQIAQIRSMRGFNKITRASKGSIGFAKGLDNSL